MLNSVTLVGRVGQNPELKYYESGKVSASFSLAVNRPPKKGEAEGVTDWFRIELWGRQAEIAGEYVRKGALVGIEGRLEFKRWIDPRGETQDTPYISSYSLKLLGGKHDIVVPGGQPEA